MRKLIYFTMASVDGYMDRPDGNLDWVVVDEELHTYINNLEREVGANLYGRRMYEIMNAYWPTADTQSNLAFEQEFSRIWKQIPKYVFSQTLDQVEGNAILVKGDLVEEVKRLKEEPGGNLEVGGAVLASTLMQAGLVDEYRLFIHPVILGAGTRMIPPLNEAVNLRLVDMHTFHSGVIYLNYQRER